MTRGTSEAGTILINVLLIVALAATAVMLLIDSQEDALDRTTGFSEAARAAAIARGAIVSAESALRRDVQESPGSDNPSEPWAGIQEKDREIVGGRFSLAIADANDRFNINNLAEGGMASAAVFTRIAISAGLSPESALRAIGLMQVIKRVPSLQSLRDAGISDAEIASLSTLVTALPMRSEININTADVRLIAAVTNNAAASAILVGIRSRRGYITPEDVKSVKLLLPPGLRFTSDAFWAVSDVTIGGTAQHLAALLHRRVDSRGVRIDRVGVWWGRSDVGLSVQAASTAGR